MYKKFAVAVAVVAFAFLCSDAANAQPRILQIDACKRIGNIQGAGRVTCAYPIGSSNATRNDTVGEGAEFFILIRFRNLPVGNHRIKVFYESGGEYGSGATSATKELSFKNDSESWAYWFPAHYRKAGSWRVTISLAEGNRVARQAVSYCIACYRGPE